MRKWIVVVLLVGITLTGCKTIDSLSTGTKKGAAIGAVAGGILGAIVDSSNPWRGAIIGSAVGAAAGGWVGYKLEEKEATAKADEDVVSKAAKDAATLNSTVKYSRVTEDGITEDIIATPGELKGNVRTVTVKYYRNGTLITTETREVEV
ncbi:MAG: glycine zipper domain-containing protein [bacterium]|nr:glycine zipper domain-containing protein [bacterium]